MASVPDCDGCAWRAEFERWKADYQEWCRTIITHQQGLEEELAIERRQAQHLRNKLVAAQAEIRALNDPTDEVRQKIRDRRYAREDLVYQRRCNGDTFTAIAKEFGISVSGVRDIFQRAKRRHEPRVPRASTQ